MKKFLVIAGFALFATTATFAQEIATQEVVNPNAPEIVFENETIDFGTIAQGADGNRVFKFKNTGKEPLILTNVRASCGCTTPNWTRSPIAPGQTGEIAVHYDTNRMGQFTKTITVQSNAKSSTKVITIKGKVDPKPEDNTSPVMQQAPASKVAK